MFLHIQNDIQIARRPAIRSRFAFTGNAQTCSGIHAGRNPQLNRALPLHSPLSAAICAAFLDNLPGTLTRRTRPVNREKSLLVNDLPAPTACLARSHTSTLFRSGSVARFAKFLPGNPNLLVTPAAASSNANDMS